MDYRTFYSSIKKPFFAPPPWFFGLAWSIIYPLIGIAFLRLGYLVWVGFAPLSLFLVFVLNLIANVVYTPIQLRVSPFIGATLDIYVVLLTVLYIEWFVWGTYPLIFILLLPYLLWGAFATVLQTSILYLNTK